MTEAIQINTYIIPKCLLLIFTIFPPENKIKNNKKQITKTTGTPLFCLSELLIPINYFCFASGCKGNL